MNAAIITIGDELLIGQTTDTNSAWMGAELSNAGFDVMRITSVHDRRNDILNILKESEGKYDVVLITGGLGPTSDDITKHTLCDYFNTRLVTDHSVLRMIEEMMERRKMPMNENNRRQAEVPESSRIIKNAVGTAPGMWFERNNSIFISMPGVPHEMKHIMAEHILPELKKNFTSQVIIHRNIMTYGYMEAKLAERLAGFESALPVNIKLAYLPSAGIIKLRLTGTGRKQEELAKEIDLHAEKLYNIIPELIYGENEETLEMAAGKLLKAAKMTVSTAESCTGGDVAHLLTSVPGSSAYFKGSVVAYANSVKVDILGVKMSILEKYGAVSENVVREMASGARKLFSTDYAVATSGIAGPDGGSEEKPVGTVWIAVASEKGIISEKFVFGTHRVTNIRRFSYSALNLLRKQIIS
jgi:nicotinamide-nucleotide amidase